jgi:hypothetical protein
MDYGSDCRLPPGRPGCGVGRQNPQSCQPGEWRLRAGPVAGRRAMGLGLDGLFSARLRWTEGPMGAAMQSSTLRFDALPRGRCLSTRPPARTHG